MFTVRPNEKYVDRFAEAERVAENRGRGLWDVCELPPPPPPPPDCHDSYKGECLAIGIGDYDCAGGEGNGPNYVRHRVRVAAYDEFGLDADGDGYRCDLLPPP